jgi:hypothetical protein
MCAVAAIGVLLFVVLAVLAVYAGGPPVAVVLLILLLWAATRWRRTLTEAGSATKEVPLAGAATSVPDFRNDSHRNHEDVPTQTWVQFLAETRQQKNSGAHVKLGSGFEVAIVGESFYLSELQWVRAQDADPRRARFNAYLVPEPENPHSAKGDAVRVESVRGATIGHLSRAHAAAYAPVFKALHAAGRTGVCAAVAVGGTSRKPNIGVWINIGHAAWLSEQLSESTKPRASRRSKAQPDVPPADQPF